MRLRITKRSADPLFDNDYSDCHFYDLDTGEEILFGDGDEFRATVTLPPLPDPDDLEAAIPEPIRTMGLYLGTQFIPVSECHFELLTLDASHESGSTR